MTWLLDFTNYALSNAPPLKVSITCNNILQNHYPERLGLAVCWHAPTLFSMTWKVWHMHMLHLIYLVRSAVSHIILRII